MPFAALGFRGDFHYSGQDLGDLSQGQPLAAELLNDGDNLTLLHMADELPVIPFWPKRTWD